MSILVIGEHDGRNLSQATKCSVSAAQTFGSPIEILIAGNDCMGVAESAAKISGVSLVRLAQGYSLENQLAEPVSKLVSKLSTNYEAVITSSSSFGKNLLPRIASILNVAPVSEVIEIIEPGTYVRPIYAGNAIATVKTVDKPQLLTIRTAAFLPAKDTHQSAKIESLAPPERWTKTLMKSPAESSNGHNNLSSAKIVISGGRGLGNAEQFILLRRIAKKLGAAVGASRAAVDSGYIGNEHQIGQTGKIVAPNVYIAIGISGAIQHIAGMRDSGVIVAINNDETAPIFEIADFAWVTDLVTALPQLEAEILELKRETIGN